MRSWYQLGGALHPGDVQNKSRGDGSTRAWHRLGDGAQKGINREMWNRAQKGINRKMGNRAQKGMKRPE